MRESLNILYVGPLWEGCNCLQRMKALQDLGHYVIGVNTQPDNVRLLEWRLLSRINGKLFRLGLNAFGAKDLAGANQTILDNVKATKGWNILWIDKGLTVEAKTLREVKATYDQCLIVGYSPDDMYARHNQSRQFLEHLPLYDIFFTTKSYNVHELKSLGCKRVEFIGNSYYPRNHKPMELSNEEIARYGGRVGFIGAWEEERADSMLKIAQAGHLVRIWGAGWERIRKRHSNLIVENRALWGAEYAKAICAFDINLGFLRKINRDLQTIRSVEIPACGGFMLAERTDEHLILFEEGIEAEFFGSDDELVEKVKYYLAHPDKRETIAAAGRKRCLRSGYSCHNRLKEMILEINKLRSS